MDLGVASVALASTWSNPLNERYFPWDIILMICDVLICIILHF